MVRGGGKSKGSAFERLICRHLSLWVSHNKNEDVYWRAAMSGGRSTRAFSKGVVLSAQAGDISCVHPIGHAFASKFYLECKFYRDLNFVGLLSGKGHLASFWAETKKQAKQYEKEPLMIAKQNNQPPVVCLSKHGLQDLHLLTRAILIAPQIDLRMVLLDTFLTWAVRP